MKITISNLCTFSVGDTFIIPKNPPTYDFIHGSNILQFFFVVTQSGNFKPFTPELLHFGSVSNFIRSYDYDNYAEAIRKLAGKKVIITALTKIYITDYNNGRKWVPINSPTIEYAE